MRSQREVDRDAAVAVLERDDDVTPQIAPVRERLARRDRKASRGLQQVRARAATNLSAWRRRLTRVCELHDER
jgi:hypothetical protein